MSAGKDPLTGREIRFRKIRRTAVEAQIELGKLLELARAKTAARLRRHRRRAARRVPPGRRMGPLHRRGQPRLHPPHHQPRPRGQGSPQDPRRPAAGQPLRTPAKCGNLGSHGSILSLWRCGTAQGGPPALARVRGRAACVGTGSTLDHARRVRACRRWRSARSTATCCPWLCCWSPAPPCASAGGACWSSGAAASASPADRVGKTALVRYLIVAEAYRDLEQVPASPQTPPRRLTHVGDSSSSRPGHRTYWLSC